MGTVTVITSGKGGVGKSSSSVGISRALASRGHRVLLIDCDAGLRSLDRLTGIDKNLVYDSADVIKGRCAPINAIYPCEGIDGLFLMPAPQSEEEQIGAVAYKRLTDLVRKFYDHVILDCPAGVGKGFRNVCSAADRALIVCNPDPVCIRNTYKVHNLLRQMGIEKQRLIINRYNSQNFFRLRGYDDLDRVIDEASVRLIGVIPEDYSFIATLLNNEITCSNEGIEACARIAARLEGEEVPVKIF
ncbi:MAG: AAA family ATPase [Clostridia bacterium]|nr:AAA family ATPase [Clostridia bacterium]